MTGEREGKKEGKERKVVKRGGETSITSLSSRRILQTEKNRKSSEKKRGDNYSIQGYHSPEEGSSSAAVDRAEKRPEKGSMFHDFSRAGKPPFRGKKEGQPQRGSKREGRARRRERKVGDHMFPRKVRVRGRKGRAALWRKEGGKTKK